MKLQRKVTWHKEIEDDRIYPVGEFCCDDLRQMRLGFNQEFNLCPFCGERIERLPAVSEETPNSEFEKIFSKEEKAFLKDTDFSLEKLLSLCQPNEVTQKEVGQLAEIIKGILRMDEKPEPTYEQITTALEKLIYLCCEKEKESPEKMEEIKIEKTILSTLSSVNFEIEIQRRLKHAIQNKHCCACKFFSCGLADPPEGICCHEKNRSKIKKYTPKYNIKQLRLDSELCSDTGKWWEIETNTSFVMKRL